MDDVKENGKFKLSLINGSYFYLEIKADTEFEMEDLHQLVECQNELGGGLAYPVLINPAVTATTNSDVIRHMTKNSSLPYSRAEAFVLKSISQKILGNLYARFRTERPIRFFSNKEDALKWIEQFLS